MSILRPSQLSSGSYNISGSFSGSFEGDGSNITGITAEWDGSHLGDASITGSLTLSGSNIGLNVLGNISASSISASTYYGDGSNLTGITPPTSSYALTASYVEISQTASYVETAQTASYVLNAVSSSFSTFAISASYAVSASHEIIKEISSSYADTASFAQSGNGIFSGSFSGSYVGDGSGLTGILHTSSSYASTASYVETSQTASYVISSSIDGITNYVNNNQTSSMTSLSSSFASTASYVETSQTASYVLNAISSSYSSTASYVETSQTASYVLNAVSSSFSTNSITSSFAQSGNGIFSGSFSGSFEGDGSGLTGILHTSASYASTASYVETTQTASYVLNAISSSYSQTSSYVETSQTASYVETAQTASYVLNAVSSSYASTSSYSNTSSFAQSGDGIFSGSFSGSYVGDGSGLTGILHTTSSYALTASYVETSQTASYVLNSQTASYVETAQTASYVTTSSIDGITNYVRNDQTSSMTVLSSSYAISSSYSETTDFILGGNVFGPVVDAVNAISSSYAITSSYVETAQTASYVLNAVSSSYALTASYAVSASHEIIKEISSSYADTASFAQSGNGIFSGSFSGSYIGDGSGLTNIPTPNAVVTASNATNDDTIEFLKGGGGTFSITVNNIETSQTASYVLNAISSSYSTFALSALSASYAPGSPTISSSYALTASYVNPLTQDVDITGQTDITGNVLVTGSLTVSGSNSIVNLQELQFDIEHIPTGHSTGRMYWDDANKTATLDMRGSDVHLQIGQEAHVYAKNISGVTIANGAAVRISGATGANLNIELALSTVKSFKSTIEKNEILGLATEEILNNQSGYITTFGSVGDLDTSAFAEGDILYLSHLVSGSYSNIRPPSPCFEARVGVVKVSNNGAGVIISRPAEPIFLTDISQVSSSGVIPNGKSYLVYDDSTDLINFTNEFSGSFSGSFQGDGSGLTGILHTSASYALTASYVETSQTASYVLNSQTSSYVETAQTASYVLNAISSSYATSALSASYAPSSPSISSSYATTASFAQSGDGIFSGSFNGSFVGDGSGLTGLPTSINVLTNISATDTFTTAGETLNCTSGTFTVNLPTAVGIQGTTYTLVNSGTGVITLDASTTETINGSLIIDLSSQYISRTVQSDGSNWIII